MGNESQPQLVCGWLKNFTYYIYHLSKEAPSSIFKGSSRMICFANSFILLKMVNVQRKTENNVANQT